MRRSLPLFLSKLFVSLQWKADIVLNGTFYLLHEFPIYYLFIIFFYINFSFTLQLLTIFVDISEVFFCSWWKNTNSAIDVAASHSAISAMNTITTVRDFTFVFCFFYPFSNLGHAEFYSAASSRCYNFRPKPFSLILSFFNRAAVIICCFVILHLIIHYLHFLAIK